MWSKIGRMKGNIEAPPNLKDSRKGNFMSERVMDGHSSCSNFTSYTATTIGTPPAPIPAHQGFKKREWTVRTYKSDGLYTEESEEKVGQAELVTYLELESGTGA